MKRLSKKDSGGVFAWNDDSNPARTARRTTLPPSPKRARTKPTVAKDAPADPLAPVFADIEAAVASLVRKYGTVAGRWTYENTEGEIALTVVRLDRPNTKKVNGKPEKTYRPITSHPDGGFVITDPPGLLPLYRLRSLLTADPCETVHVFEGEKAADAAVELGLLATTSAHGSNAAHKSDWSVLAGRSIVIFPDADSGGEKYAEAVKEILLALSPPATVRVVRLRETFPQLPDSGDIANLVEDRRDNADTLAALGSEVRALAEAVEPEANLSRFWRACELIAAYPKMRPFVIEGLLREGEVMNIVAAPKTGKSWLAHAMLVSISCGTPWFGHRTSQGDALLIDGELHHQTLSQRLSTTAKACGMCTSVLEGLTVWPARGARLTIDDIKDRLAAVATGTYRIIMIDALYRFLPLDGEENSNKTMTQVYNTLDEIAKLTGAAIGVVHHASKGSQVGKSVTDVGSGAGAQSRAPDTHLILRPHEEAGAVVVEAVLRTCAPLAPFVIRWRETHWERASDLDPTLLETSSRASRKKRDRAESKTTPRVWQLAEFAEEIIGKVPLIKDEIIARATARGITKAQAASLISRGIASGEIHEHPVAMNTPKRFASAPPNLHSEAGEGGGGADPAAPGALGTGGVWGGTHIPPPFPRDPVASSTKSPTSSQTTPFLRLAQLILKVHSTSRSKEGAISMKTNDQPNPDSISMQTFANTVLAVAAEVERDETALKNRIDAAAAKGDSARIAKLMAWWRTMPPSEVLRRDDAESP